MVKSKDARLDFCSRMCFLFHIKKIIIIPLSCGNSSQRHSGPSKIMMSPDLWIVLTPSLSESRNPNIRSTFGGLLLTTTTTVLFSGCANFVLSLLGTLSCFFLSYSSLDLSKYEFSVGKFNIHRHHLDWYSLHQNFYVICSMARQQLNVNYYTYTPDDNSEKEVYLQGGTAI